MQLLNHGPRWKKHKLFRGLLITLAAASSGTASSSSVTTSASLRDRSHAQPVLSWFQHVPSSNYLAFSCIITDLTLAMGLGFVISERWKTFFVGIIHPSITPKNLEIFDPNSYGFILLGCFHPYAYTILNHLEYMTPIHEDYHWIIMPKIYTTFKKKISCFSLTRHNPTLSNYYITSFIHNVSTNERRLVLGKHAGAPSIFLGENHDASMRWTVYLHSLKLTAKALKNRIKRPGPKKTFYLPAMIFRCFVNFREATYTKP